MDERITRAVAGEQEALAELLYARHDHLISYVARRLRHGLKSQFDPEDILQDTFIVAFQAIGSFQPKSDRAFNHWLESIAENRLVDAVRSADRKKRGGDHHEVDRRVTDQSGSYADLLDMICADSSTPSSCVSREEGIQTLRVQMARLPDDYRDAIRLRHLDGLSLQDTAQAMNRPQDAVRGLLHRAKKKLRERMGQSSLWFNKK